MTPSRNAVLDLPPEPRAARAWLGLALAVLLAAGLFAFAVVVGRMPPFDRFVTDPLFFKRCLVAHVNLALVVWFYSFVSALLFLVPGRQAAGRLALHSPRVAGAGVALMLVGAALPESHPILSNYIPTLDHGLFRLGQLGFGAGVLLGVLDPRLLPGRGLTQGLLAMSPAASAGLRAAAAGILLAALTFAVSLARQPAGVEAEVHYELLFWGLGHVLQLVSTLAMLAVWLLLLDSLLGRPTLSGPGATALFGAMLLPWLVSPLLALQGTWSSAYRVGFTSLMQWGIFPFVSIFLVICATALCRAWREARIDARSLADPRLSAFLVSSGLTLLGFALGAAIRGSTTMVPAHYHASVGAVTVSFMAATFPLLGAFRISLPSARLRRVAALQPALYGVGMLLFSAGFALAGAHGMGRKVYGAEQAARGLAESVGLGVMGFGGFVAIAGGLLFLGVIAMARWRGTEAEERPGAKLAAGLEVAR